MIPIDCSVDHLLQFDGIDEDRFIGGGMDVVDSDVGLWVRGSGRLVLDGCPRTPWVRADGDLLRGVTTLRLRQTPSEWHPGDELVIMPTASTTSGEHYDQFDTVTVVSVSGNQVTVTPALSFDHPAHDVGRGTVVSAEVLNLTRNVRIEGRPGGRAHVHMMGAAPQEMRNFALRHVGPRASGDGVLGRYGLHFHMGGDMTRGSLVEGAVVRDCGSHAYVPHASHGITFRSCISHNTVDDAYWWDPGPDTRTAQLETNGLTYEACIASRVKCEPSFRGYRLAGFSLGRGVGNRAIDCVAAGVQGNKNASGFLWPEDGVGVWEFLNCVAHNNRVNGIFTWQNTSLEHVVARFTGYHNGQAGIEHGAYLNGYRYENSILFGNGQASVRLHALSHGRQLVLDNLLCDGAGVAAYGIEFVKHTLASNNPVQISRSVFLNQRVAAIAHLATEGPLDCVDVIEPETSGREIFADDHWVGGTVRWFDRQRGSFQVRPAESPVGYETVPIPGFSPLMQVPDRSPLTAIPAAILTQSDQSTDSRCITGAGAANYVIDATPSSAGYHNGRESPKSSATHRHDRLRARLRRGRRRRAHLAFVIVDNPGNRVIVELFAGRRRVKRAKIRNGRTILSIRLRRLHGRKVRLCRDSEVIATWMIPPSARQRRLRTR
jgi:hypothetical protein